MVFAPLPFVDVTASWRFSSKWHRIATAAAGVYLELFVAAVAIILWSCSSDSVVRHAALERGRHRQRRLVVYQRQSADAFRRLLHPLRLAGVAELERERAEVHRRPVPADARPRSAARQPFGPRPPHHRRLRRRIAGLAKPDLRRPADRALRDHLEVRRLPRRRGRRPRGCGHAGQSGAEHRSFSHQAEIAGNTAAGDRGRRIARLHRHRGVPADPPQHDPHLRHRRLFAADDRPLGQPGFVARSEGPRRRDGRQAR